MFSTIEGLRVVPGGGGFVRDGFAPVFDIAANALAEGGEEAIAEFVYDKWLQTYDFLHEHTDVFQVRPEKPCEFVSGGNRFTAVRCLVDNEGIGSIVMIQPTADHTKIRRPEGLIAWFKEADLTGNLKKAVVSAHLLDDRGIVVVRELSVDYSGSSPKVGLYDGLRLK